MLHLFVLGACGSGHPPEIVGLDLSPAVISPGDEVQVLVEVADPEGSTDLVAGWVEIGSLEVARLEQGGFPGTFGARLGDEILPALPDFEWEHPVGIRVVVTDTAGNRATRTRALTVTCGPSGAWCGAGCVDPSSDPQHCGACGASCDSTCTDGVCLTDTSWTTCERQPEPQIDCEAVCAESGRVCTDACAIDDGFDVPIEGAWVRYARTSTACQGDAGMHVISGGPCGVVTAEFTPVWVSCCCAEPSRSSISGL